MQINIFCKNQKSYDS